MANFHPWGNAIHFSRFAINHYTMVFSAEDKPLVIPEINGEGQVSAPLIANPNCTTAVGAMALWPIHQKYKLKKAWIGG